MVDRIRQLYKVTHEMEQKLGRVPTNEELAHEIGRAVQKVDWMLRVSWLPLSLESPINEDEEDAELGQFVEDQITPTPDPERLFQAAAREGGRSAGDPAAARGRASCACVLAWKTGAITRWKKWARSLA